MDSTNVCQPILTGITTIGLDHVALLGDSLESIAEQKAGIIKQGVPLVTGDIVPEALAVIDQIAKEKEAPRLVYGEDLSSQSVKGVVGTGEVFDYIARIDKVAFRQDCWVCTR